MKLSVHNVYRGGFDYYEAPDTVAINDDHATPDLSRFRTTVGIPASVAGRPMPRGAVRVGHGDNPVGSISSGKSGSWISRAGGGVLPSGMGLFDELPCPTDREGAVIGALFGVVLHLGSGQGAKGAIRGLAFVGVGGLAGYLVARRACDRGWT